MNFRSILRLSKALSLEVPLRSSSSTMAIFLYSGSVYETRCQGAGRLARDSPETSLHPTLEHQTQSISTISTVLSLRTLIE
jgi:hypothetical protein